MSIHVDLGETVRESKLPRMYEGCKVIETANSRCPRRRSDLERNQHVDEVVHWNILITGILESVHT